MAKWYKPYWLIDHLPAPREWRLSWLRSYIDRSYGQAMRAAHSAKNAALEERIQSDWQMELTFIADEEAERFSRNLLHKAHRLRVPIPAYYVGSELSPDYE